MMIIKKLIMENRRILNLAILYEIIQISTFYRNQFKTTSLKTI